jgi:cellulose synthase (UDP-forming)
VKQQPQLVVVDGVRRRPAFEAPYPDLGRTVLILLYVAVGVWYLHWRIGSFNDEAPVFSLTLYAAEAFGFITALLHIFMTWRPTRRTPPPPMPGSSVDVFITTINEPLDVVRRTALAAIRMEYPHQTWVLDDGARPAIQVLASDLGCLYLARENNAGAKAGNLNHGLAHSTAEFVAVFDADHAPHKDFLNRTLGFFANPRVAFVQTPQDFYNLDSYQHRWKPSGNTVWTEQSLFFRIIQQGKDFWNAAFFCGSCGVIRRTALDAIGGFAADTVTEDLHTSIRLHKRGFDSVYYAEALAFGLAPDNLVRYLRQRVRWGQGAMQVWRKERILTSRGLTLPQRLCYLASVLTYFDGWQKAVFYFAPVVVLLTGVLPVAAIDREFFWHFTPYYVLTFLMFEEVARGYGRTFLLAQYNMARFFAFIWATSALFRRPLSFFVTDKSPTAARRFELHLLPHYLVLLLNAVAIPVGIVYYGATGRIPEVGLTANVVWAGVNCTLAVVLLRFTLQRAAGLRALYRFPIPLPARVKLPGRPACYATIDDISPAGCRIHAKFPMEPAQGGEIRGEIHMPHGVLPFAATVCGATAAGPNGASYIKSVGARFNTGATVHVRWELERFLYGSDLQWRIHRLRDRLSTPLSLFANGRRERRRNRILWAPALLESRTADSPSQLGLMSCHDYDRNGHALLTFRALPVGSAVSGLRFTRSGQALLSGKITTEERFDSPGGPIYMYRVSSLIREQKWIREHILAVEPPPAALVAPSA